MKTAFTLSLVFAAVVAMAQSSTDLPRKEFVFNVSESVLYLKPGESKTVTVSVVRSKHYAKEKATLGFSSSLPKEITIQYEPAEGNFETSVATITAGATAAIGAYQLVLNGTLNHVTKGSILKVMVGDENIAKN